MKKSGTRKFDKLLNIGNGVERSASPYLCDTPSLAIDKRENEGCGCEGEKTERGWVGEFAELTA